MAYRFQSFRRLLRSVLALMAAAALAAWAGSPAEASVLLFILPDGAAETQAEMDNQAAPVWPWTSPSRNEDIQNTPPTVKLAPELSMGEPADSLGDVAIRLLSAPLADIHAISWRQHIASWTGRGAELRQAICDHSFMSRLLRTSSEAEELALIETADGADETRLEAAPVVAASVLLPAVPAAARGSMSVEELTTLSRNMLSEAGLDTAGIHNALSAAWSLQPSRTLIVDPFDKIEDAATIEDNAGEKSNIDSSATQPSVPLSVLTRPLLRGAAEMLDSAGGSLQALAAGLTQLSEATPASENKRQATRPSSQEPQIGDTTALPQDPAAQQFFGF